MRIVYKLPLLLVFFLAIISAMMLIHEARIVDPGFERLELDLALHNADRVSAALTHDIRNLETMTRDWSQWDDSFRFASGRNPTYIEENLEPSTWENICLDLVTIFGPERRRLYSGIRDRASGEITIPAFFPPIADDQEPYVHPPEDAANKTGFLRLEGAVYMIASCPILPNEGYGPTRGSLIMGRLVDESYAAALSEQTGVQTEFATLSDSDVSDYDASAYGEKSLELSADDREFLSIETFNDIYGNPVLEIRTRTRRVISAQGDSIVRFFRDSIISSCLLFGLLLVFGNSRLVTNPLAAIRRHIALMDEEVLTGVPSSFEARRDEIGDLAKAFNTLAAGLAQKRRELEEANANLEAKIEERTFELALLAKVFESTSEAVVLTDLAGTIVRVNTAFCIASGYSEKELIGQNPRILKSGRHDASFYREMWRSISERGYWSGEIWDRKKNGETRPKWLTINKIVDERGLHCNYVGISADITEVKASEARMRHLAYYDPLTGLPNRLMFRDRLEMALARCSRFGHRLAVIFIDLDRFKYVNDSLGHAAGDKLLVEVSRRISRRVRESDAVCRLGGDEFTLILERLRSSEDAAKLADSVIADISSAIIIDGKTVFVGASMGIAIFPFDDTTSDGLIRKADAAMYRAKELGRNTYRFVSGDTDAANQERLELDTQLRQAVEESRLQLYYQPIVDRKGRITAAEALLRWKPSADGEMTLPARSIQIAEESGLIIKIGEFVVREACCTAARWISLGAEIRVSVNVSARQFEHAGLADLVADALRVSGLPPHLLDIEISESTIMSDIESARKTVDTLKEMGVGMTLDDFGTGYASLSYISRFPLDRLKIDRSFIREAGKNRSASSLVNAVVAMAFSLGMNSVAEGVETEAQRSFLISSGCNELQGFYFGRPAPAEKFGTIVASGLQV